MKQILQQLNTVSYPHIIFKKQDIEAVSMRQL